MILKVLFIQRKESYTGEYAPEAQYCATEFDLEENSAIFDEAVKDILSSLKDDIAGWAIVDVEVPQEQIRNICLNNQRVVGKIVE